MEDGFILDIDDMARLFGGSVTYIGNDMYSLWLPSRDCEVIGDYSQIEAFLEDLKADDLA